MNEAISTKRPFSGGLWPDLAPVGFYTGWILWGLAALMGIPILVSMASGEWTVIPDFLIGAGASLLLGSGLVLLFRSADRRLTWSRGMLAVAVSWLAAMLVSAIPSWLSGHYGSYLDACFDIMSGFTTTGLALIKDLDHVSDGLNTWRHLLSYLGGQGMIVLTLTFLLSGLPGAYKLYVGEGKDERLFPSAVRTARAIWVISLVYLAVGTVVIGITAWLAGLQPYHAFLHGMWLFMAAFSTGGFAPNSQNIIFYHSFLLELGTMVFFVIGSLNFGLHYAVWAGNRRELWRNLEAQVFIIVSVIGSVLAIDALAGGHPYGDAISLFRRGVYQVLSAQTTTGFMTVYAGQFGAQWGGLAVLVLTIAMMIGGSASSTAGGFKGLRVGLAAKTLSHEVRRLLAPESALTVTKFHFFRDFVLEDRQVRSAFLIMGLYVMTFAGLTLATTAAGYPIREAAFEAASATGNVGLTIGVATPAMPALLKAAFIVVMWAGRLEFMALLVLVGYFLGGRRGR